MTRVMIYAAVIALTFATNGAAGAEPPTCGAPTAIDSLRDQAIEHFKSDIKPRGATGLDQLNELMARVYFPDGKFDIKVDQMFALSRSEDVRECRASMHLVEPGRVSGDSPVFYAVARSEDGHDLVSIKDERALYSNLLQSLTANNSEIQESLKAFFQDQMNASNNNMKNIMRANPGLNRVAPKPGGPSNFSGTGNRDGAPKRFHFGDD